MHFKQRFALITVLNLLAIDKLLTRKFAWLSAQISSLNVLYGAIGRSKVIYSSLNQSWGYITSTLVINAFQTALCTDNGVKFTCNRQAIDA